MFEICLYVLKLIMFKTFKNKIVTDLLLPPFLQEHPTMQWLNKNSVLKMPEDIATQDVVGQDLSESEKDKEKIRKLEAQVFQLKNIIVKLTGQKEEGSGGKKQVWSLFSHISLSFHIRKYSKLVW